MRSLVHFWFFIAASAPLATLVAPHTQAHAAAVSFVSPTHWQRDEAGATYQAWDVFTLVEGETFPSAGGEHRPDVGYFGPLATGTSVVETSGDGLLTSTGNIYSPVAATSFRVENANYSLNAGQTTLVLQIGTRGTEIEPASLVLKAGEGENAISLPPAHAKTLRDEQVGSAVGSVRALERWYLWALPGNLGSYAIEFSAAGTSMSLTELTLDTFTGANRIVEPIPGVAPIPGDFNNSGRVDLLDFAILRSHFGEDDILFTPTSSNDDGVIDLLDFAILRQNFSRGAVLAPEPGVFQLMFLMFASLFLFHGMLPGSASRH